MQLYQPDAARRCICNHLSQSSYLPEPSGRPLLKYIRCVVVLVLSVLTMSTTLSGLIALENPTVIDGSASSLTFDSQMWLGPGRILMGTFRYYNTSNYSFPDVGQYFSWIHVSQNLLIFNHICLQFTSRKICSTVSHAARKRRWRCQTRKGTITQELAES